MELKLITNGTTKGTKVFIDDEELYGIETIKINGDSLFGIGAMIKIIDSNILEGATNIKKYKNGFIKFKIVEPR
jgi:hypothetical protein